MVTLLLPEPDDPDAVIRFLMKPLRSIRDALDAGVSLADGVMDRLLDPSPHLWADLVRHHAHSILNRDSKDGWEPGRDLQNGGIEMVSGPFVMRTFKAANGGPPHPGRNGARRRFWEQETQYQQLTLLGSVSSNMTPTNLIVDWTITDKKEVLIALSKPKSAWGYKEPQDTEWHRAIKFTADDEPRFDQRDEDGDEGTGESEVG